MEQSTSSAKRIYILVDRTVREKKLPARSSFWNRVKLGQKPELHSISDSKEELKEKPSQEPIRIDFADIVIVKWDAANGDYACGSDDVLLYFLTREDRRTALLANGGILLSEFQSGKGVLHQRAYDVIFGEDEVTVYKADLGQARKPATDDAVRRAQAVAEAESHGPKAHKFERFRNHPLVRGLPSVLESKYVDDGDHFFNFSDNYAVFQGYKDASMQLWRGWFVNWKKGWIPLLIAAPPSIESPRETRFWKRQLIVTRRWARLQVDRWFRPPRAVLLAKIEGNGLLLASTMWIAGSRCQELVDQFVKPRIVKEVQEAHREIRFRRGVLDGSALALATGAYGSALWVYLKSKYDPHRTFWWLAGDVGFTWLLIIAFRFWKHFFLNRPFGTNLLQFFNLARKSFWDTL